MHVMMIANTIYIFWKEAQNKRAPDKTLTRPASGIQEYDKVELVQPDQTHRLSVCVGKQGLTRYGYHVQEERGDWYVGWVTSDRGKGVTRWLLMSRKRTGNNER